MRQNSSPRRHLATKQPDLSCCSAKIRRFTGRASADPVATGEPKTFRRKKSELCGPGVTSNSIYVLIKDNISQV